MNSLINIIHFNNICIISAKLYIFDTVILWESFEVIQSEQLLYSIVVAKMNSLRNIVHFDYIKNTICIILAKLLIFDTVILWESLSIFNSGQLSHSINVSKINSLWNITYLNYLYNTICIIIAKLFIFNTLTLWGSFRVLNSEQLSHSTSVQKMNSFIDITRLNTLLQEKSRFWIKIRIGIRTGIWTFVDPLLKKKSLLENGWRWRVLTLGAYSEFNVLLHHTKNTFLEHQRAV